MKSTRKARITSTQRPAYLGVARYLTGSDLERMVGEYNKGHRQILTPKGQALTRTAFAEVATYLRWDDRLEAQA